MSGKDTSHAKTIRLLFPQWQGGDNTNAYLGAKLLAWLAPSSTAPLFEVPLDPPHSRDREVQDGIMHRQALTANVKAVKAIIEEQRPDKIIVFGGDCLVDQVPFSYLNKRYGGKLGVLWIDTHPDVKVTGEYPNAHTMVLGNLLGEGDSELAKHVEIPLMPSHVMFAGLRVDGLTPQESEIIGRRGLKVVLSEDLKSTSAAVLEWISANDIRHLAIHFDLDVLDPKSFRSTFFTEPNPVVDPLELFPVGTMRIDTVTRLLTDVSKACDVVGLGITEHLPWDAINLKSILQKIPILSED